MKFAAFFVVLATALCACGNSSAKSLNGTWHDSTNSFVAQITQNKVRIDIVDEGDATLYWKGTFRSYASSGTIVSKGDVKAMDKSILGSLDKTKRFTYANGRLSFRFSILGQTRTIKLRHS